MKYLIIWLSDHLIIDHLFQITLYIWWKVQYHFLSTDKIAKKEDSDLIKSHGQGARDGKSLAVLKATFDGRKVTDGEVQGLALLSKL